jgi:hypothetical protein
LTYIDGERGEMNELALFAGAGGGLLGSRLLGWEMARNSRPLNEVIVNWPTPSSVSNNQVGRLDEWGGSQNPIRGIPEATQALNPDWVEWLMGFPIGWTDVEPFTGYDFMEEGSVEFWENNIDVWWHTDPADVGVIPRVTDQKRNRVNRLKALGNGQVPLCFVTAWNLLTKEDTNAMV